MWGWLGGDKPFSSFDDQRKRVASPWESQLSLITEPVDSWLVSRGGVQIGIAANVRQQWWHDDHAGVRIATAPVQLQRFEIVCNVDQIVVRIRHSDWAARDYLGEAKNNHVKRGLCKWWNIPTLKVGCNETDSDWKQIFKSGSIVMIGIAWVVLTLNWSNCHRSCLNRTEQYA